MPASSGYTGDLFNCGHIIPVEDFYASTRVNSFWHRVVLGTHSWSDLVSLKGRDDLVFRIKLAEEGEDYEEMFGLVKQLVRCVTAIPGKILTVEERNLLSVANKNLTGSKKSYGYLASNRLASESNPSRTAMITNVIARLQTEIAAQCSEVEALLQRLLRPELNVEDKAFFYKIRGDINRWATELLGDDDPKKAGYVKWAFDAYRVAMATAEMGLHSTNPIRLGTALNFSVFYHETVKEPKRAIQLARKAFDDAIADLDAITEESYKDSTLIMGLLRDNVTLWESDEEGPLG